MESNSSPSLFEMKTDPITQEYLASIGKWCRIIAIIAIVIGGLLLLALSTGGGRSIASLSALVFSTAGKIEWLSVLLFFVLLALAIAALLFLFRASMLIKKALVSSSNTELAEAFDALKNVFVISIVFSLLGLLNSLAQLVNF